MALELAIVYSDLWSAHEDATLIEMRVKMLNIALLCMRRGSMQAQ